MEGGKFVGGSALARKRARKRPPSTTQQTQRKKKHHHDDAPKGQASSHRLPKRISPPVRFFASLFLSTPDEFLLSEHEHNQWSPIMAQICGRAGVPIPAPLNATDQDMHQFFGMRASLVLEEARYIIVQALISQREAARRRGHSYARSRGEGSSSRSCAGDVRPIEAMFLRSKKNKGFQSLIFGKKKIYHGYNSGRYRDDKSSQTDCESFTPSELYQLKPGCVVEICVSFFEDSSTDDARKRNYRNKSISILGNVNPLPEFDDRTVALMVYQKEDQDDSILAALMNHQDAATQQHVSIQLMPITNLISEQRQFVACYHYKKNLKFLPKLMGMKSASHTRFDDSDDDSSNDDEKKSGRGEGKNCGDLKWRKDGCVEDIQDCVPISLQHNLHQEENKVDDEEIEKKLTMDSTIMDHGPGENEIYKSAMDIPSLNPSQEKAAQSFLNGPIDNLSLVQGPPGTGKTQFMTACLCRTFLVNHDEADSNSPSYQNQSYWIIDKQKRVLVAAPTNKAISVLASRYLRATRGNSDTGLNAVLIGVEEALFPREDLAGGGDVDDAHRSLRGIFVYTWVDELVKDFETLKLGSISDRTTVPSLNEVGDILHCAQFLVDKLNRGLPVLSRKSGAYQCGTDFLKHLRTLQLNLFLEEVEKNAFGAETIIQLSLDVCNSNNYLAELIQTLRELKSGGECIASELLATANIIFVTLSSSGGSILKRSVRIDELFVDEAAAATEPEILIPLHLRPSRMLCVGDPKQLPASVSSPRATSFGLDKSLLERLMYGCGKEHVMLDVQYRMAPPISEFPRAMFYSGKLSNGKNVQDPTYKSNLFSSNEDPYKFIQVQGKESRVGTGSYCNHEEAKVVVRLVQHIRNASHMQNDDVKSWASIDKLRIITFYSGQVYTIKRMLREVGLGQVMVATVDSSQGCESDIVIVSFVRCEGVMHEDASARHSRVGFLNDIRRINVAITRAKFRLFCVGDAQNTLLRSNSDTVSGLANDAIQRNLIGNAENLRLIK